MKLDKMFMDLPIQAKFSLFLAFVIVGFHAASMDVAPKSKGALGLFVLFFGLLAGLYSAHVTQCLIKGKCTKTAWFIAALQGLAVVFILLTVVSWYRSPKPE